MEVKVTKLTDVNNLRRANGFTSGKDSNMSLATAYKLGHTTIRTQLFEIALTDIPLFVASQLVRQTQGVQWYQRSKRTDRGGLNFRDECKTLSNQISKYREDEEEVAMLLYDLEEFFPAHFDRYAPTNLFCQINAEALMNMARKRLCSKASKETVAVVSAIRDAVRLVDTDLAKHMVPQCIYRGGICPESLSCGYNVNTRALKNYQELFKQPGDGK